MKKIAIPILLLLNCIVAFGQDQFTNSGNFQTHPGATIAFFGDFVNDGTFSDNVGAVTFKGTANQLISGSSPTSLYNMTVNNATGITLQQNIVISNTLTLTSGALDLNSMTLTVSNNAIAALSRTGGYILSEQTDNSGKVTWNIGATTGAYVFPFGSAAGVYIPFTVDLTAGNIGNVTVSTYPTAANNTPLPSTPVAVTNVDRMGSDNSANVVDRFWQIDKDGPSGTATITFTVTPAEAGTITTLLAQRWNGATSRWEDPLSGQSNTATSATVPDVTAFSPWTLSGNSSSLPIELLSFTAAVSGNDVNLNWKTASEVNNDYFTIQRSVDGISFSEIAKVSAKGAHKEIQKYNYVDRSAPRGRSYYRLKQTDLDGVYKFTEIRMVELEENPTAKFTTFPNPVVDQKFSIDFHKALESSTTVIVYNTLGRIIFQEEIERGMSVYAINLTSNPPPGVYVVKAFNLQSTFQQSLIIK